MAQRRFSLEEDFMNYKTDDLVYGFMRSISTAYPTDREIDGKIQYEEYLTVKTYKQNKKVIAAICGITAAGVKKRLDKLIEVGLVQEATIRINDEETACYTFPYDYNGTYKLIDKEMVSYLVSTRNPLAIRVYLYLLNCSTQKDNYVFTVGEIKTAFGYAPTTKSADIVIQNNLESFQKEGIIKFNKQWFECINRVGVISKTERMVLQFVATRRDEF